MTFEDRKEARRLLEQARQLRRDLESDSDVLCETFAVEHARRVEEELEAWLDSSDGDEDE